MSDARATSKRKKKRLALQKMSLQKTEKDQKDWEEYFMAVCP